MSEQPRPGNPEMLGAEAAVSPPATVQPPAVEEVDQNEDLGSPEAGSNQTTSKPEVHVFSEEELRDVSFCANLSTLLVERETIREEDNDAYSELCRNLISNQLKKDSNGQANDEDIKKRVDNLEMTVGRLASIQKVVKDLIPDGGQQLTPSQVTAKEKVLTALTFIVSEQLVPTPADPAQGLTAVDLDTVDQEEVARILQPFKIRFVVPQANGYLATQDESGALLLAPSPENTSGYNLLNLGEQVKIAAKGGTVDDGLLADHSGGEVGEEGDGDREALLKEHGITAEDQWRLQHFRTKEAFALASVFRKKSLDLKSGGAGPALSAEMSLMFKAVTADPTKEWNISDVIQKSFETELRHYRDMWQFVKDSGINIDDLDTSGAEDFDYDTGSDESSGGSEDAPSNTDSKGKEKTSGGKAGERAGGSKGPQNAWQFVAELGRTWCAELVPDLPGEIAKEISGGQADI